MYRKPVMQSYAADEFHELIGPVETQYACDVDVQPDPVPFDEPGTVIVNFSSLPTFDSVILEIPGAEAQMPISVPRSAGQIQGTDWIYTTDLYNLTASFGQYTLIVRLADGSTVSEPCSTTFELLD